MINRTFLQTIKSFVQRVRSRFQPATTPTSPVVWMTLAVLLIMSAGVRFWKMEYVPYADDADELAYTFAGQSLWEYGRPISWSSFKYPTTSWQMAPAENHTVNHPFFFTYINPWFDHAPLIPMYMGGLARWLGYDFPSVPPAMLYRLPMVAIGVINLWLIFLIGKKVFNAPAGLFSVALLGFSPVFFFAQRMLVSENVILLFLLSALWLYLNQRSLAILILASVLGGLSKLTGLIIVPIIFLAFFGEKKYKTALFYACTVVGIVAVFYLAYGTMIGQADFFAAMKNQSFRLLGWSNPSFLFSQPGFHIKPLLEFSYYAILIMGLVVFSSKSKPETRLLSSAIIWLLVAIWATGGEQDTLGWYKIPLFGILGLTAGYVIYIEQYVFASLMIGLTVLNNVGLVRYPTHPLPEAPILRFWIVVLVSLIMAQLYLQPFTKRRVQQAILVGVILVYGLQSLYIADAYFDGLCRDKICPTPTVTFSQTIRDLLN